MNNMVQTLEWRIQAHGLLASYLHSLKLVKVEKFGIDDNLHASSPSLP